LFYRIPAPPALWPLRGFGGDGAPCHHDRKGFKMSHSKTRKKAKPARSKRGAKEPMRAKKLQARPSRSGTKQEAVLALLRQPAGATIAVMTKATGWQQHSVRGFLAGVVRKRLELKLGSTKVDGVRAYRIAGGEAGKPKPREAEQQSH
jgi:Protein of unknown function (DUF3489)